MENPEALLFEDVNYYVFDKNVTNPTAIKQAMKKGGATREFYLNDLVTHIISDTLIDKNTMALLDCHLLHSDWVTLSVQCGTQLPMAPFDLSQSKLLSGLTFCTSKLSHPDMERLIVLVTYYGGKMQRKLDANVTHLVTMETTGTKYECATSHSDSIMIVSPDWLLDSINMQTKLDEFDYHPSKLRKRGRSLSVEESPGQPLEKEQPGSSVSTLVVTTTDIQTVQSENIQTNENGVDSRQNLLQEQTRQPSTILEEPLDSVKEGVNVKSSIKELTLPCKQNDTKETTENLPQPQSDSSTKVSSVQPYSSTNLAVQSDSNIKVAPPVNQSVSSSSNSGKDPFSVLLLQGVVVCFSDYQECMDKETVEKWKQVIQQHGGQVLEKYNRGRCTHLLALHKKSYMFAQAFGDGKCIASAHWLNDVLTEQKMFPPRNPLHFPTAFKWQLQGAEKYSMTLSNYTEVERELVKDMVRICGIPCTGHLDRQTTHLVCKRPEGKKYDKAKEWGVQVINSTFLADIIHNGQLPAVLFPRYTKLGSSDEFSPGSCFEAISLLKPWERFMTVYSQLHPDLVDKESTFSTLHTLSQTTPTSSQVNVGKHYRTDESNSELSGTKKQKLSDGSEVPLSQPHTRTPVVLVTGISHSVANTLKESIQKLGGRISVKGSECTHIVLPRVTRTVKFLSGLSVCDYIVTPDWVEGSLQAGRFVSETDYWLVDKDAEELFGMNIAASLARAKAKKLLEGVCFHSTVSVQPPHSALKDIIQCAGGELLSLPELRTRFGRKLEKVSAGQLLVISTPEDVSNGHCTEFFKIGVGVYNAELVLTGILRQELDYPLNRLPPQ